MIKKILLPVIAAFILFSFGCKLEKYSIVQIPVPSKKAIDFLKYKNVYYLSFLTDGAPEGFSPEKETDSFFLSEFPKVIGKNITAMENREEISRLDKGSLVITGKILLSIDKRSIIDTKVKKHKKRNVFVKIENWNLKMDISFHEVGAKEPLLRKVLQSALNSADPKRPDYNFKYLFRKVTEKFIRQVMRVGKTETRFLLKK